MDLSLFNTRVNIAPARGFLAITPSDSTNLSSLVRALFVGGTGNAVLVTSDPDLGTSTATFTGLVAGLVYPFQIIAVKSTGTTATGLIGLQ